MSYELSGEGEQFLLLFHGFGLTKEIFDPWTSHLHAKYCLIKIDLFYHGESEKALGYLQKTDWKAIVQGLLNHLNIDRFSVLGFSLGGRFAICTALELSNRCDELILIGPDAVYKTPYFRLATSPVFRPIFKFLMFNPRLLDSLISAVVFLRIAGSYLADFVRKELGEPANRRRVYISWNHFKPLGYTPAQLNEQLKKLDAKKVLIVGTRDIVIKPHRIIPILQPLGFEAVEMDKKHHQLVKEDTAEALMRILK